MGFLHLSGKRAAGRIAIVDDLMAGELNLLRWYVNSSGHIVRSVGKQESGEHKQWTEVLARRIMGLERGDKRQVDHINRDPLDNRTSNLRVLPPGGNQQNYSPRTNSSSRYRGVSWHKGVGKWMAYGFKEGKLHHHGYFEQEHLAAEAALAWRREHMPYATD